MLKYKHIIANNYIKTHKESGYQIHIRDFIKADYVLSV